MIQTILLPVDGSAGAERAARHLIALAESGLKPRVIVLNVQPALPGDVSTFVDSATIADFHRERSEQATAAVRRALDSAGVGYVVEHAVGGTAEQIAAKAAERDVDLIVMGSRGLGTIGGLLLGSVATKVLHLVERPVTLVR